MPTPNLTAPLKRCLLFLLGFTLFLTGCSGQQGGAGGQVRLQGAGASLRTSLQAGECAPSTGGILPALLRSYLPGGRWLVGVADRIDPFR